MKLHTQIFILLLIVISSFFSILLLAETNTSRHTIIAIISVSIIAIITSAIITIYFSKQIGGESKEDQIAIKNLKDRISTRTRDLEQSNAALEKSNADLEQFAYVASHDLKAPLRAISNLSTWIGEDVENPTERIQEYIDLMHGRILRMESLIDGILEFSRIGRKENNKLPVDLNKIVNDIAIPDNFELQCDSLPTIIGNKVRLEQVFTNLISNCIKHHDEDKGLIKITYEEKDYHVIRIADDGPGINPVFHKKVFQIFQTLKSKDDVECTGIGLTLVKKIMEENGGEINIESFAGHRETTIILKFPNHASHNSHIAQ